MNLQLAAALILALAVLAAPSTAEACRCKNPALNVKTLERADAVFVGEVVATKPHTIGKVTFDRWATFVVQRSWKGVEEQTELVVDLGTTSCMLGGVEAGQRWLIFAKQGEDNKLATRNCLGSRQLDSKEDGESRANQRVFDRMDLTLKKQNAKARRRSR